MPVRWVFRKLFGLAAGDAPLRRRSDTVPGPVGLIRQRRTEGVVGLRIYACRQAAAMASYRLQHAQAAQISDDLHQVISGYAVMVCQFADGHQLLRTRCAIHQHAQGVVGVLGQTHACP